MLNFNEIRKYLPQQFPMIMVDKVLDYEKGKSVRALKNVTGNEIFFLGHFPQMAIMPGALILEGLGQSAMILFGLTYGTLPPGDIPLYGAVNAKFLKTVVPGDQLIYEVEAIKLISHAGVFKAVARVESGLVARAEITLGKQRMDRLSGESSEEDEPDRASVSGLIV